MTLKLTYFDIRGLAEPIRLLLNDQEIPFEDNRISREEWAEMKSTMVIHNFWNYKSRIFQIFAQLPCLHIGTETIVQSAAILRHLGRIYGEQSENLQFWNKKFIRIDEKEKACQIAY